MRDKPSPELMRALETLGKRPVQPPATPQELHSLMQGVATLSLEQIREEWRIIRDRKWDWHDQNIVVRPFVDALIARASTPSPEGQTCEWRWDDDSDVWRSSCPTENYGPEDAKHDTPTMGWKVCPYCTNAVRIMPFTSPPTPEGTQP